MSAIPPPDSSPTSTANLTSFDSPKKRYIVISHNQIGWTSDSKLASRAKEIQKFLQENIETLSQDQLLEIQKALPSAIRTPKQLKGVELFLSKMKSIVNWINNEFKTERQIFRDIRGGIEFALLLDAPDEVLLSDTRELLDTTEKELLSDKDKLLDAPDELFLREKGKLLDAPDELFLREKGKLLDASDEVLLSETREFLDTTDKALLSDKDKLLDAPDEVLLSDTRELLDTTEKALFSDKEKLLDAAKKEFLSDKDELCDAKTIETNFSSMWADFNRLVGNISIMDKNSNFQYSKKFKDRDCKGPHFKDIFYVLGAKLEEEFEVESTKCKISTAQTKEIEKYAEEECKKQYSTSPYLKALLLANWQKWNGLPPLKMQTLINNLNLQGCFVGETSALRKKNVTINRDNTMTIQYKLPFTIRDDNVKLADVQVIQEYQFSKDGELLSMKSSIDAFKNYKLPISKGEVRQLEKDMHSLVDHEWHASKK